jgi:hypothetical protein
MSRSSRRLSTLGADAFTSDDVVDLATATDVRISADLEIDATVAQRLLDQISPTLPVTGAQITASPWPPPKSSRPAAPPVSFSSPGAVTAVDYDASCEPNSRRHHRLHFVVSSGTGLSASYS